MSIPRTRALVGATLGLGLLVPGCPLTDNYYIDHAAGAAGRAAITGGTSGLGATGGNVSTAGISDGVGGDMPSGNPPSGDAGAGATSGDEGGASNSTGGDTSVSGTGGALGSGGSTGSAGDTAASGGANPGGSAASGGIGGKAPMGGRPNGGGKAMGGRAAGGAPPMGGGGLSGTGGAGGAGLMSQYQPLCDDSIVKGSPCDQTSVRVCYRTCGPDSVGYKSETCQQNAYAEQSGCSFPSTADYSCYALPSHLPPECPVATIPQATDPCEVPACTVCFGGTPTNPLYQDSTGTQKGGYCVCSSAGTWTCASTASWPCPDANGCK